MSRHLVQHADLLQRRLQGMEATALVVPQVYGGIDWASGTSPMRSNGSAGTTGLESMISRLSHSVTAAAPGTTTANTTPNSTNANIPVGISRNANRYPSGPGPLPMSPLGGPAVTQAMRDDDDDLFRMDR